MCRMLAIVLGVAAVVTDGAAVLAQGGGPVQPPGSEGMDWQLGAIFTGYWVVVAVAIAFLSRPPKRADKPKKPEGEIAS